MISLELQPFPGCGPPWTKGRGPSYYRLCCDCGMVGAYTDVDEAIREISRHISVCRRALAPRGDKPGGTGAAPQIAGQS